MQGSFRKKFAGVFIALLPIMCPYGFGKIPIMLLIAGVYFLFSQHKNGFVGRQMQCVRYYTFFTLLLSFNGFLLSYPSDSLIFSIISAVLTFVFYSAVFCDSDFAISKKYLYIGGYCCCAVLLYQVICEILGLPHFTGELPFFNNLLGAWPEETYGYRFNSLFSEPSYFAIYMLPLVVMAIRDRNLIASWVFGAFIVLSSSSLGIVTLVACIAFEVVFGLKGKKSKLLGFAIIAIVGLVTFYIVSKSEALMTFIELSQHKFERIEEGESDLRLIGYLSLYNTLPQKESIFGVGLAQMGNYFRNIYNYSNTPVTTLINSGFIGLIILIVFWVQLFVKSKAKRCITYFLVFLAVSFADPLIFSDRYYYLLYFILFCEKSLPRENKELSKILIKK